MYARTVLPQLVCDLHDPSAVLFGVFIHKTVLGVASLPQIVVLHQTTNWLLWELREETSANKESRRIIQHKNVSGYN